MCDLHFVQVKVGGLIRPHLIFKKEKKWDLDEECLHIDPVLDSFALILSNLILNIFTSPHIVLLCNSL
jgi:hypothetical protein